MVVGYAAFSTNLEIKGTSKVTSNWDIEITNVTEGTPTGSAENTVKPSWDKLWASMEADLYDKGDSMEYDVTIENKGNIDAKLNDILTNVEKENNEAVIITFSGYTKGEILKANSSKQVHVKIEYNPEYEGGETSSEVEINFDYVQNDNETSNPDIQYLVTYDYQTNGGTNADIKEEYYGSGNEVNLDNKAYKEGWTFVGWNTDKDANIGLTNIEIKENTTLYAIYSKTLKVTYEKGENVESIGKVEDTCNIYNNNTTCEITLPEITVTSNYIISGWYKEDNKVGNPKDKYSIKEDTILISKATEDKIELTISTSATTNSITVIANATSPSGIKSYEYRIDDGEWIASESNTYTFTGLTANTSYNIEVKVTSISDKQISNSKEEITNSLELPIFEETNLPPKTITITFSSGCGSEYLCSYQKNNEEIVNVITDKVEVEFTISGNLVATISDGINKNSISYNVIINNGFYTDEDCKYYYLDGSRLIGWFSFSGDWYYANENGCQVKGWVKSDWHTTETYTCPSQWYYLDEDGLMVKGWKKINNKWYYFAKMDGKEHKWQPDDLHFPTGCMMTGWVYSEDYSCASHGWYFKSDGSLATNTYIGDYYVDSSGCWIQ